MRCKGCCNPEMLPFEGGSTQSVDALFDLISQARASHGIEGVTFLGGEPFSQAAALAALAAKVQKAGLTVMIFSGYTRAALERSTTEGVQDLLEHCDLLVDGPFVATKLDHSRRWIGSTNQVAHALSPEYRELVQEWDTTSNTLEVRIENGKLVVNGSPFLLDKLGLKTKLGQ